jgi:hypothetical protein
LLQGKLWRANIVFSGVSAVCQTQRVIITAWIHSVQPGRIAITELWHAKVVMSWVDLCDRQENCRTVLERGICEQGVDSKRLGIDETAMLGRFHDSPQRSSIDWEESATILWESYLVGAHVFADERQGGTPSWHTCNMWYN